MIEIKDNGEKLVDVGKFCPRLIIRLKNNSKAYVRETVAKKIYQALNFLPDDTTFIINSAWRSAEHQKRIYRRFCRQLKKEHPDWSERKLKNELETFVAPYEGDDISGHMSGGAVDIRLSRNNRRLPMKSVKLSLRENSLTNQSKLPKYIIKNRQIMINALTKTGLTNYPKEYWHWCYGDIMWAKINHKKYAVYGKVELNEKN